jgi:hypothetical protein
MPVGSQIRRFLRDTAECFVTPAARVELFPTASVSPWISLGGSFGHSAELKNLLYGGINPGKGKTCGVLEGGLGQEVRVWERLSIREEGRDFRSGKPDFHYLRRAGPPA